MRAIWILLVSSTLFVLYGCSAANIANSWKVPAPVPKKYSNILVLAIIKDVPLRKQIEDRFVTQLYNLGYRAGSAMEEYGPYGLGKFSQEQTYVALSNNGYDAVLTIVVIDKEKEKGAKYKHHNFSNTYYYNRIINYAKFQVDLSGTANKLYWETILFDLHTLETRYTVQTKLFNAAALQSSLVEQEKAVVKNMLKKKVLVKRVALPEKATTF